MYVCMYVCMCVCVYVCMYVCMYVCCMYVCMYVCTYVCMDACMYVCVYIAIHIYICVYIYIYRLCAVRSAPPSPSVFFHGAVGLSVYYSIILTPQNFSPVFRVPCCLKPIVLPLLIPAVLNPCHPQALQLNILKRGLTWSTKSGTLPFTMLQALHGREEPFSHMRLLAQTKWGANLPSSEALTCEPLTQDLGQLKH